MGIYIKLLVNDFRKRAWKNIVLFMFMCLSVTIAATVVLMLSQLFSSITSMYETAKPPHFLQMHMGTVNQTDIDEFNESFEVVTYWQTAPMIDLYGDTVTVKGNDKSYTLSDCCLDISFVKQNDGYDVLLDEKRQPLHLQTGEIGIPEKGIENLYLSKIRILMCSAGVVGFLLALLLLPRFTGHISRFFGEQPLNIRFLLPAAIAVALIYCIILLIAKKILKQIKKKPSLICLY